MTARRVLFGGKSLMGRVLATRPMGFYPLIGDSGTIMRDRSGNGHNGQYTGATLNHTPFPGGGNAPFFDGINDDAVVTDAGLVGAINVDGGTLLIWAKMDGTAPADDQSIAQINDGSTTSFYNLYQENGSGNLAFEARRGGAGYVKDVVAGTASTAWQSLALTWSASAYAFFINGAEAGGDSAGGTWGDPPAQFRISGYAGNILPLAGAAAYLAIWNRILSGAEIRSISLL